MTLGKPATSAAARRRPSPAAAEIVLLALAEAAAPFVQPVAGAAALVLAGVLRIERLRNGMLSLRGCGADGRWRPQAQADACGLLDPAPLIDLALGLAIGRRIAAAGAQPLTSTDRAYVEKRLAADLHPDARGAATARAVRRALLDGVVDRAILRPAALVFGRTLSVRDYNDVVRAGAATLARLAGETPNLMPLLQDGVRRHARKGAGPVAPGHVGSLRHALLDGYGQDRFAPRDWKWLSHQARCVVAALLRGDDAAESAQLDIPATRLFAAGGARPPATLTALIAPGGALQRALATLGGDDTRLPDLARLLRLCIAEWRRRAAAGASTRFIRDDLGYLVDWWIAEAGTAPLVPSNATYASLIRRQQRWHQLVILRYPEHLQQWHSALAAHESAGVRAVPLTDSLMLAREGMDMRHCVASYARDCAAGHTRIFALEATGSGERATLELRRRASLWFAGQLKGPCNGEVSAEMRGAAERIAARYTRAAA